MNTHAEKTQEKNNQSNADTVAQKQETGEAILQAQDNRPQSVAQRKLQNMANNSAGVKQLQSFQEMADNSPQAKQAASFLSMVPRSAAAPVQRQEEGEELQMKKIPVQKKEESKGYTISDIKQHYTGHKPAAQLQAVQSPAASSAQGVVQMVKPGSKAAAQALMTGNISKKKGKKLPAGQRHYGNHGGVELREQLTAAGDTSIPSSFQEFDVNDKVAGEDRDEERIVVGDDGRIWYTASHYAVGSFVEIT